MNDTVHIERMVSLWSCECIYNVIQFHANAVLFNGVTAANRGKTPTRHEIFGQAL